MIFKKLSAWITDDEGEALPEYQTREIDENTIECWIPSTEGANFWIRWKPERDPQRGHDLRCRPHLDGISCSGTYITARRIARKENGTLKGHVCGKLMVQPYCFGKRKLTDNENIAPLSREIQKDLNTIQAKLQWGHVGSDCSPAYKKIPESRPLHEKMAKKGHSGSAGLDKPKLDPGLATGWSFFEPTPSLQPITFVFRYAPQDWLQAREIIPSSQQSGSSSSPEPNSTRKRARSATPEVIDIDDLETDDDEIVIVKHMVPAPTASNKKPRKVKDEEDVKPDLGLTGPWGHSRGD